MGKTTEQSIFNRVVKHLRKQKVKSWSKNHGCCVYRDEHGNKCAVGCLITDKEYTVDMEEKSVYPLNDANLLPKRLINFISLLCRLQNVHDNYSSKDWESGFAGIAHDFDLTVPT